MIPFYENRTADLQAGRSEGMDFLPHFHGQLELLYVEDGEVEVTISGCTRTVTGGELAVAFPNSVHSYRTPKEQQSVHCMMNIINLPLAGDYINTFLKFHPKVPFIAKERLHKDVPYAMRTLLEECAVARPGAVSSSICKAYTQILISRLLPELDFIPNTDANFFNITYQIIQFMNENFTQPISLEDLSKSLGVSKYHLSRVFSDKINVSFNDYLNGLRAGFARNLLAGTGRSVTEIAYDCGFQSVRTFNRAFQKIYAESPRKYRNTQITAHPNPD